MFIERDIYTEITKWVHESQRKPLLLEGARQVGKTEILKALGEREFEQFYYFNFESDSALSQVFQGDISPKRILEDLSVKIGKEIDPGRSLIIFDEIQSCPRALTSLKYFAEDQKNSYIAAAGSLLGVTLGEDSFPVGKVERKLMFPLNLREFIRANSNAPLIAAFEDLQNGREPTAFQLDALWKITLDYFCCGGLPEVVVAWYTAQTKLEKFNAIRRLQQNIYNDYLADIAKHSGGENAVHIETVLRNIPAQLAREIDGSASKFQFKDVIPGRKSFKELRGPIDWLRRAGLVHQIYIAERAEQPLSAYCKDNRFKLYLFDLGILRHLSGFQPEELTSWGDNIYKGFYAENFVLTELLSHGLSTPTAWREGDSEVEFLVETPQGIVPLEVKSGKNTRSRSLTIYLKRYKPRHALKLVGKEYGGTSRSGVQTLPLFAVLLNLASLRK